jgi:archaellum biogenesis ATPase FlaH
MASENVSTGIDAIDRELSGGVRTGTIVALEASPASQSETILKTFMRERPAVYVSTLRNEAVVRDEIDRAGQRSGDVSIEHAGVTTPIENVSRSVEQIDGAVNVIVDPITPLERSGQEERYVNFLNSLKTHLINTDSVAMLHCPKADSAPQLREYTRSFADLSWELAIDTDGAYLENRLIISKNRGGQSVEDIITVQLGQDVTVDLSRDIA